uniref:Uncharacterized protein n=1 Tax=Fundulus heteroclitus TaxID=8078 RepID=A0A3Q2Q6C8_FUNHE
MEGIWERIQRRIQEKIPISSEIEVPSLGCSMLFNFITPILQISVGAVYLDECPIQEKIPIFLITFGVIQLVLNFTTCLSCKDSKNDTLLKLRQGCTVLKSITTLFLFCWFIAGNVWVYSVYQPSYSKNATDVSSYCNKTLYLVALWTVTAVYIILGLILLLLLIGCCVLSCLLSCDSDNHNTSDDDDNNTHGDNP